MTHRRTLLQRERIAAGRCPRCGEVQDRDGRICTRCNDEVNALGRQRYRPGKPSEAWTIALMAAGHAVGLRGWL